MPPLGGIDVVEMGQIKVFVQELGLKQGFLADTNMDYLTSEWPRRLGPKILKVMPISICSLKSNELKARLVALKIVRTPANTFSCIFANHSNRKGYPGYTIGKLTYRAF